MAKVQFKRVESVNDLDSIPIEDGNFIVTGDGKTYVDYGTERKGIGGTPDNEMSDTSMNSVENKVVKEYVDSIAIRKDIDENSEQILVDSEGNQLNPKIQRYEELKKSTVNSGTAIKCIQGTIIKAVSGNATALFTFQELNEMFGVENCTYGNIIALICNGDGAACNAHFDGATLADNTVYATLDAQTNSNVRINYIIFYLG